MARTSIGREHQNESTSTSPAGTAVLRGSLLIASALVLTQTAAQLVDYGVYDLRYDALNSDRHASIFGIASLIANGVAACAAAVITTTASNRRLWLACSVLVATVLGVRIANLGSGGTSRYLVLLPLVGAAFVALWRATRREPSGAKLLVGTGLTLLVLSYVVHVVGPRVVAQLGYSNHSWAYELKGVLKHDTELGGWTLIAGGLVFGLVSSDARRRGTTTPAPTADAGVA